MLLKIYLKCEWALEVWAVENKGRHLMENLWLRHCHWSPIMPPFCTVENWWEFYTCCPTLQGYTQSFQTYSIHPHHFLYWQTSSDITRRTEDLEQYHHIKNIMRTKVGVLDSFYKQPHGFPFFAIEGEISLEITMGERSKKNHIINIFIYAWMTNERCHTLFPIIHCIMLHI